MALSLPALRPTALCYPAAAGAAQSAANLNGEEQREREIPSGTKVTSADVSGLKADFINNKCSQGGDRGRKVGQYTGFLFCGESCYTAGRRKECIWLPSA